MEWTNVLQRMEAGEDRTAEFKREFGNDLSAVGKAICAFANCEGGLIVLGIDDAGSIVGLSADPYEVHERLTSFLQTGYSAPVGARYGRHEIENGWIHWIEVPRIRGPEPLRCRGRVYIRRERSSTEPSPAELQELYNSFGFVFTEEQTVRWANASDIDMNSFRSFVEAQGLEMHEEPQPSREDDLRNAGILAEADGALYPTLYGLMVFGKTSQRHRQMGNFVIRCSAYAGRDAGADVILADERGGRIEDQVRGALTWMASLGRTETYRGLLRKDRPLIPESVLREALVNAVVHRDYAIIGSPVLLEVFDDRVSVTSPGALPNHMTVESVRAGSRPRSRNESMAHAMVVAGLMERRGRGWPVMRRAMLAFNDSEPEILNDRGDKIVRVTFRLNPEPAMDEAQPALP